MNPFLNLVAGERYLFYATSRNFIATYVKQLNNTLILTKYTDKHTRNCGGVYSYTSNDILDAFPLSELVTGHKYRIWYLETINDENKINVQPEYFRKSRDGIFIELTDILETLRIDTRDNPENLRMGIFSCPLYLITQIEKL